MKPSKAVSIIWLAVSFAWHLTCDAQFDIEEPPIEYSKTIDDNRVTELMKAIKNGQASMSYDRKTGYLKSLLAALDIPLSSQVLVFSKTSLQIKYISPRSPRAIYFNDETYVGWVHGSSLMEISTNDPKLGAAFYTLRMSPSKPRIHRQRYNCLACHATAMTQGVPGHTVRSVMPKPDGTMDMQRESFVTDHTSPFTERWGGWFVTGQSGDMTHMGNAFLRGSELATFAESNRTDLRRQFFTDDWLTPHSDIVALMVLEHQTQMQNMFTNANFTVRKTLYEFQQAARPKVAARSITKPQVEDSPAKDDAQTKLDGPLELEFAIDAAAKKVVDYMLFVDETRLSSEIKSSTTFAADFTARGPVDSSGRSLRDFNLRERMFEYPCSYLIYSPAFDSLEPRLRQAIYRQLWQVLRAKEKTDEYTHLKSTTRRAILEILRATKSGLPDYWIKG